MKKQDNDKLIFLCNLKCSIQYNCIYKQKTCKIISLTLFEIIAVLSSKLRLTVLRVLSSL
jgi:hypothetical protein